MRACRAAAQGCSAQPALQHGGMAVRKSSSTVLRCGQPSVIRASACEGLISAARTPVLGAARISRRCACACLVLRPLTGAEFIVFRLLACPAALSPHRRVLGPAQPMFGVSLDLQVRAGPIPCFPASAILRSSSAVPAALTHFYPHRHAAAIS